MLILRNKHKEQEMLPLVLKHVEGVTSCGNFPCLAILSPLLYSFVAIICSLSYLCLDL